MPGILDSEGQYGPPTPSWGDIRGQFAAELEQNPALLDRLFRLTKVEVGGQGPEATQAFLETVFNRSHARGVPLAKTINDKAYYPSESIAGKDYNDKEAQLFGDALARVVSGSNISGAATGNASGKVMFAGGPQTYAPGTGERFGIEGPDINRAFLGGATLPQYPTKLSVLQLPVAGTAAPMMAGLSQRPSSNSIASMLGLQPRAPQPQQPQQAVPQQAYAPSPGLSSDYIAALSQVPQAPPIQFMPLSRMARFNTLQPFLRGRA